MKNIDKAKEILYDYRYQVESLIKDELLDRIIFDENLSYYNNIQSHIYDLIINIYDNEELQDIYNIYEGDVNKLYLCLSDAYNYFFELDVEYNEELNTVFITIDVNGANLDYPKCDNIYQCLWFLNGDNGEIEDVYDNTVDITVSNFDEDIKIEFELK